MKSRLCVLGMMSVSSQQHSEVVLKLFNSFDLRFSCSTYGQISRPFDFSRYLPVCVVLCEDQLHTTLDNRRVILAREANLTEILVKVVHHDMALLSHDLWRFNFFVGFSDLLCGSYLILLQPRFYRSALKGRCSLQSPDFPLLGLCTSPADASRVSSHIWIGDDDVRSEVEISKLPEVIDSLRHASEVVSLLDEFGVPSVVNTEMLKYLQENLSKDFKVKRIVHYSQVTFVARGSSRDSGGDADSQQELDEALVDRERMILCGRDSYSRQVEREEQEKKYLHGGLCRY